MGFRIESYPRMDANEREFGVFAKSFFANKQGGNGAGRLFEPTF
jgi:hypothetical protein